VLPWASARASVAKAHEQFDEAGRMQPSPYYDRLVDVSDYLTCRYSEREEEAESFPRKRGKAV
jgi:arsenical resistance protein ArsH